MAPEQLSDISIAKLVAGVAGALTSTRFLKGTWPEKLTMAAGGAAFSYFAATPLSAWLDTPRNEGLVGYLVGLFGMALVAKAYEVIQAMDSKQIAAGLRKWAARKWKA
jgi:hypothetical protein